MGGDGAERGKVLAREAVSLTSLTLADGSIRPTNQDANSEY